MSAPEYKTSPLILGIAWLVVSIPLAWGVYKTLESAVKIF